MNTKRFDELGSPAAADAEPASLERRLLQIKGGVTEQEWSARVDLAALYRLVDHSGWTDSFYTHISMRVPGEDSFLINPFGYWFHEITASCLAKVNVKGEILSDPTGLGINRAGFVIHGAIHGARHDVGCVLHTHTRAGIAVATLEEGLLPISQHSSGLVDRIAYHDFEGIAIDTAEQERLVRDLKTFRMMILRNHGLLTAGRSAAEAFCLMSLLQRACEIQVAALSMGKAVRPIRDEVRRACTRVLDENDGNFARDWRSLMRLADRIGPDFRN